MEFFLVKYFMKVPKSKFIVMKNKSISNFSIKYLLETVSYMGHCITSIIIQTSKTKKKLYHLLITYPARKIRLKSVSKLNVAQTVNIQSAFIEQQIEID